MSTPNKSERWSHTTLEVESSSNTGRSFHSYTTLSHENMLRNFSKMSSHHEVEGLKRENERLRRDLEAAEEQVKEKQKQIDWLERKLALANTMTSPNYLQVLVNQEDVQERCNSNLEVFENCGHPNNILSSHFNEVMRRYHKSLEEKDVEIRDLREALARCREQREVAHPEEQIWSHHFRGSVSIEDERLRRTEAAVKVFKNDLDAVKNQLKRSPLSEEKYVTSSAHDRAVLQQLERRNRFWMIADIEKMGLDFLKKLEFEEKLDAFHSKIESRRFMAYKDRKGAAFVPECTYNKEFEMLETTRNNLLKALGDLRSKMKVGSECKEDLYHVSFKNGVYINTIQSQYDSSRSGCPKSDHEWPEK